MTFRYALLSLLFLSACSSWQLGFKNNKDMGLLSISYPMAEQLHNQLADQDAALYPILATSFVDSANMNKSNDLGRLLSEQIASRLSQLGYAVLEMQLRSNQVAVNPHGGVLILSRELSEIHADVSAYSALVGTYTTIEDQIYVNVRVLRVQDGLALASADTNLPFVRTRERGASGSGLQVSAETSLK